MASSASKPVVVVIPARLNSTRLPRKMLLRETGKTLVQHTYEGAAASRCASQVIVATDCDEIADEVRAFGGNAQMTSVDCASGTDRVAEVAQTLPEAEIFVNVQGDEPEIAGEAVDACVSALRSDPDAVMSTLASPIRERDVLTASSCVKVICDAAGRAIYFSRGMLPFARKWDDQLLERDPPVYLQHMGIYAFRRDFLLRFPALPKSPWEQIESLEQLRALHAGFKIAVQIVDTLSVGIDTPEEYQQFVRRTQEQTGNTSIAA
ncbi:MAG: 3-deoxy-manno-octulosonate cytidylyltransferase [Pirellulales bacterium]|nr:3-deoxy-manno-octulosonate cytidylyltransferase [Pirellulales bacterium]